MSAVRIFLPTYRRPHLLPRAIASLRKQTFTDWTCEVHNDAPDDRRPGEIVSRLSDPRFTYHPHPRNLGGTVTFNLFFRATAEPYYAMLEDDNAWKPEFLATMLEVAARHPDTTVFWSNQQLAEELPDGTVAALDRTVHADTAAPPRRVPWGQPGQLFGALHAHGAALFRSRAGDVFATPEVPIALVEPFRERLLPHPLVYVAQPLAEFSLTRVSARSRSRAEWAIGQAMLAATHLRHAQLDARSMRALWAAATIRHPPATSPLLLASLIEPACRGLRRLARPLDWIRFLRSTVARPAVFRAVMGCRRRHADWWEFLDAATAARFAEARAARP